MNSTLRIHEKLKQGFISMLSEVRGGLGAEEVGMLDAFLSEEAHFTLDTFAGRVTKEFPEIDRRDVGKFLDLLVDYGIASQQLIGGVEHYEHFHLDEHHDHLICMKCGAIEVFHDDEIETRQVKAAAKHGFVPFLHRLEIHGLCASCRELLPKSFRLAKAFQGDLVVVKDVVGGRGVRNHLASIGITKGVELKVLHAHGRHLVLVRGSRIALGRGMASKIEVVRVEALSDE